MSGPFSAKNMPKDGLIVMTMLKEAGIQEYEPRVVNQLLEFVYKYTTDVLEEARVYSHHARKKAVDSEDVKLALNMHLSNSFISPPPKEMLLDLAKTKNAVPLNPIKPHCGPRLPPDRYCQFASNYRMVSNTPAVPVRKSGPGKHISMGVAAFDSKDRDREKGKEKDESSASGKRGTKRPRPDASSNPASSKPSNASGVGTAGLSSSITYTFNPGSSQAKMEDDDYD